MIKKTIILTLFLFLISIINVNAQQIGCCTNPGALSTDICTDPNQRPLSFCCPTPESSFPQYYESAQNPENPVNFNDCITRHFFQDTACTDIPTDACSDGCCCSDIGGSPSKKALCQTGDFRPGQDCSVCPPPECNDGIDNDDNDCADFEDVISPKDSGCSSAADTTEAGGVCQTSEVKCSDPFYVPDISNLDIAPVKGQKKFQLSWQDECKALSYDVSRCQGSACIDFRLISFSTTNSFEDSSLNLEFGVTYSYKITAHYNIQLADSTEIGVATLGDIECLDVATTDPFCKDNAAYICDGNNILVQQDLTCPSNQVCIITNNKPTCVTKAECNYPGANPFGLFYTRSACEFQNNNPRYCFYDNSQTSINSCFSCDTSMVCNDFKSQESCENNNCNLQNCRWRPIASDLGIGVCVDTETNNCQFCEQPGSGTVGTSNSFSSVFDICTEQKSEKLSVENFQCFFKDGKSLSCEDVTCLDYQADECSANIGHNSVNEITNPSNDDCGIRVCQDFGSGCRKNADGDNQPDCSDDLCELDYFRPETTLIPIIEKGVTTNLIIEIFDKSSSSLSETRRDSDDYTTYICLDSCNQNGHPFELFTNSYLLKVSNLNLLDGITGDLLLTLSEGANKIKYYSQDPADNIGLVKEVDVTAFSKSTGPEIIPPIIVSGATDIGGTFYTNDLSPTITVRFFEDATITRAVLRSETGTTFEPDFNTGVSNIFQFDFNGPLQEQEYTFELNAKASNGLFMKKTEIITIIIDDTAPMVTITPVDNDVLIDSEVSIILQFNERVNLNQLLLNNDDNTSSFTTEDDIIFRAEFELEDGNFIISVNAEDYAGNQMIDQSSFVVNAQPLTISLIEPSFGVSSVYTFDIVVETDNNAECRYSFPNKLDYEIMGSFDETNAQTHKILDFTGIPDGSREEFNFYVRCNDPVQGFGSKDFTLQVDQDPPTFIGSFAFPDPVIEDPPETDLIVETDKGTICKYSETENNFNSMENEFPGFEENSFRTVHKINISAAGKASFNYFVACMAKNELISNAEISFTVDLDVPIQVKSNTVAFSNTTDIVLVVETNKKSQCEFSKDDPNINSGTLFGGPRYKHRRALQAPNGKNTFYVRCFATGSEVSDILKIEVTVDTTAPVMEFVDDTSRLKDNPEFTWRTNKLRVKWLAKDDETKVASYEYTLEEFGTLNTIVNWTRSFVEDDWLSIKDLDLINGAKYFFRVRAENIVGLTSEPKDSDGVTIDITLKPASCSNNVKDGDETDVDCGGPCGQCLEGRICIENIDCRSGFCNANSLCAAPSCTDNIKNQDESDVDCGGLNCQACQNSRTCNVNNDCGSFFCGFGICKDAETCQDGKVTGTESDVDCGGACPNQCNVGKFCDADDDCISGASCYNSVCTVCSNENEYCGTQKVDPNKDTDGDGIPDKWEIDNGLDPNDPSDALQDFDNDGLTNFQEYKLRTNIYNADTDGDNFSDKEEVDKNTDPLDPESKPGSKIGFILLLIFLIIVLIAGSYFGYVYYMKQQEEIKPVTLQPRSPMMRRPSPKSRMPVQKSRTRMMELLKKRQAEKKEKREKMFSAFGGKTEKPTDKKQSIISKKPSTVKAEPKTKESIKKLPVKKTDVMERLRKISERTVQKKQEKKDVFKELKGIVKSKNKKTIKK